MVRSRRPAGVPTGGQYAPEQRLEPDVEMSFDGVEVVDTYDNQLRLTPGLVDDNARRLFRNGHCASLALAIHDRCPDGWGLAVLEVFVDDDEVEVVHVAVRSPNGQYLDVDGLHSESGLIDRWGNLCAVRAVERIEVVDMAINGDLFALDPHMARSHVDAVLAHAGLDQRTFSETLAGQSVSTPPPTSRS